MRSKSERRAADQLAKVRTIAKMKTWSLTPTITPEVVGKNAAVHCRDCSCFLCKHTKDVPPRRERAALAEIERE